MDDSLSFESLLTGAKKFAGLALQAHRDRDDEVFVLHTGVSIERLMKATLAKTNPVLLMQTGAVKDDRALLHFAGLRPHTERVRTVSASAALSRIRSAGWLTSDPELDELIELRNGVVHLGPTEAESADVLATFGRTTNALLARLGIDPADYWGNQYSVIEISLNDQLEKVERDVKRLIEQARHRYRERTRGFPLEAVQALRDRAVVTGLTPPTERDGQFAVGHVVCPACENPHAAVMLFTHEVENEHAAAVDRRESYAGYTCTLCELPLATIEHAEAAGIDVMDAQLPEAVVAVARNAIKEFLKVLQVLPLPQKPPQSVSE
ncbi:hypothetical protein [Streptomyces sp. NPDC047869]|uniref:hypothetical protein n=1 Tax=Streptomyces sp. NPDC047869 TaxID=3154709 RepID=UPI003451A380